MVESPFRYMLKTLQQSFHYHLTSCVTEKINLYRIMIILNVNMIQRVWTIFSTVFILVCIVSYISIIIYFYTVVETLIYLSSKIVKLTFHHQLYN